MKNSKRRNPVAKQLRTDIFRQRVVPMKTKKRTIPRKNKHRQIIRDNDLAVFVCDPKEHSVSHSPMGCNLFQ